DSYTPELIHGRQNTLYVFALPQAGSGHPGPVKPPITPAADRGPVDPAAAAPARSVAEGVFSLAQASAGHAVYSARCAACHGARFEPTQGVPPVRGPAFLANWRGRTVGELYRL